MRYIMLPIVGGIGSLMVGYYGLKPNFLAESVMGVIIFLIAGLVNLKDTSSLKAGLVSGFVMGLGGVVVGITIAGPTFQNPFDSSLISGLVLTAFGLVWNYFFAVEERARNSDG